MLRSVCALYFFLGCLVLTQSFFLLRDTFYFDANQTLYDGLVWSGNTDIYVVLTYTVFRWTVSDSATGTRSAFRKKLNQQSAGNHIIGSNSYNQLALLQYYNLVRFYSFEDSTTLSWASLPWFASDNQYYKQPSYITPDGKHIRRFIGVSHVIKSEYSDSSSAWTHSALNHPITASSDDISLFSNQSSVQIYKNGSYYWMLVCRGVQCIRISAETYAGQGFTNSTKPVACTLDSGNTLAVYMESRLILQRYNSGTDSYDIKHMEEYPYKIYSIHDRPKQNSFFFSARGLLYQVTVTYFSDSGTFEVLKQKMPRGDCVHVLASQDNSKVACLVENTTVYVYNRNNECLRYCLDAYQLPDPTCCMTTKGIVKSEQSMAIAAVVIGAFILFLMLLVVAVLIAIAAYLRRGQAPDSRENKYEERSKDEDSLQRLKRLNTVPDGQLPKQS